MSQNELTTLSYFSLDGASTSGAASRPECDEPEPDISDDSEFEEFEDFARRKFAEIDRQKFAELDQKQSGKMTKILFKLGNENESESFSEDEFSDDCAQARSTGNDETQKNLRSEPMENDTFDSDSPDNFVVEDNESICSVIEDEEVKI